MLMQNNFSKCREWVPRGTSQHKWRWLTTLLLILTLGIGQMWGTLTAHTPGIYEKTVATGGYGCTLTTVASGTNAGTFEVYYFSANSKYGNTTDVYGGGDRQQYRLMCADNNSEYQLINRNGTGTFTASCDWIEMAYTVTGFSKSDYTYSSAFNEFFATAPNGGNTSNTKTCYIKPKEGDVLTLKVSGYVEFAILGADNGSSKYMTVAVDGGTPTSWKSNTLSRRSVTLTTGEHTIVVANVGSSANNFYGFSLKLPSCDGSNASIVDDQAIYVNDALDLEFSSDNVNTVSYSIKKGGSATSDASVTDGVFKATVAGTYVVTATQAKDASNHCAVEESVTITVNTKTPVGSVSISGDATAFVGMAKTLTASADQAVSEYKWEVDGVDQGVNAATFDFSAPAAGTYSVVCKARNSFNDPGEYISSSAHQIVVSSLYGELIRATLNGGNNATMTGIIGGTFDSNLGSGKYKLDKNVYMGVQLASGSFQEGDTVIVSMTTAGSNYPCLFADKERNTLLYLATETSSALVYKMVLPAAANNKNTVYLSRDNDVTYKWNPVVAYISVVRPMPVKSTAYDLTAVKINGTPISAAELATLKTADAYLLDLATEYPEGPTVKFARQTTNTYEDDSQKVINDTITVTATEVSSKWQAQATIGTITYTVKMAKSAATAKVYYYDGATKLGEEIVAINANPTDAGDYDDKNLASFVGWYNNSDLAEEHKIANIAELVVTADVNVYGKWTNQYATSANIEQWVLTNGTSYDAVAQLGTLKYASNITNSLDTLNDDPSKDNRNYAYLGLKIKASGKMLDFRLANGQTVKVKFGATGNYPQVALNGGDYAAMSLTDNVWTYTAEGADAYISIKTANNNTVVIKQVMINEDLQTVTLPWRVTYDANGGTCATAEAIWSGAALILPDVTPADADHTFAGWYDEVSGGSLIGAAGASYTPTDNTTLHAHFAPVEYAVNYAAGDHGSGDMAAASAGWGTEYTAIANPFTPESGYIFAGWAVSGVDGVSSIAAGGSFTMPKNEVTLTALWEDVSKVAVIVETNVKYESLADAVAAATDGQTIQLLQNNNVTAQVEVAGKAITLDLAGYKIEYTGTSTLPSGVILVHNGASLTIDDSSDPDAGSIVSGADAYAAIALTKAGDDATNPAVLVINGGIFTGYYYAITGNGSRHNTEITINAGTFTGTAANDNSAIYHPQQGTLIINGGTFTGYSAAIELRAGTLEINDGTFTATATEYSCNPSGSGTTTVGAAIAIAQHNTQKDIAVTINGGTFEGVKAINEANPQGNPAPAVAMSVTDGDFTGEVSTVDVHEFISGGTYDAPVTNENCAYGYVPAPEVAPGVYTVMPKDGVEIIGVVVTGNTTGTVSGLYKGDASVNLNSKKLDSGKYIYVTLKEGYTFEENDVLIVDVNAKSNIGTSALEITTGVGNIDGAVWKTLASDEYSTGDNSITLEGIAAGQTSIGLKRSDNQNAKINGLRVLRPMKPMLTAITIDDRAGVINEAAKTVAVQIPYESDLAALTVVPTIVWNEAAATNSIVVNDGSAWIEGANTYKLTDKDGDYTVYTITLTRDVQKHTVSFNTHGGSAVANELVVHGESLAAAPADPTKEENVFKHWAETEDGEAVDVTSFAITADKEFHAVWEAEPAGIKLFTDLGLNTTNFISAAKAEDSVVISEVKYPCLVNFASNRSSLAGAKQGDLVMYSATTDAAKIKFDLYNANGSAKTAYVWLVEEGDDAATQLDAIEIAGETRVKTAYYEFNGTKNRTVYLTSGSKADIKVLQAKVIESGNAIKQFGQAGYSLNLNHGRFAAATTAPVQFEGATITVSSEHAVLNSSNLATKAANSFNVTSPVIMHVERSGGKYYVYQDPADKGTLYSANADIELNATGTWYFSSENSGSAASFTLIRFDLPKCEKPTVADLANVDYCQGSAIDELAVSATVSDGGTKLYQWYHDGAAIDGAEAATYQPTADGEYYVVVVNTLADHQNSDATQSNTITVTGHAGTVISGTTGAEDWPGADVTISVEASGKNLSYAWYTCDDALGTNPVAVDPAVNAAELDVTVGAADSYYKVIVSGDCGDAQEAIITVVARQAVDLQDVTGNMTWDFSKANDGSAAGSNLCNDEVLANVAGIVNNSDFKSDNIKATANKFKSGKLQASMIKFHTTVDGMITVVFSNTGGKDTERYLTVNGRKTDKGSKTETAVTYTGFVYAGDVELGVVEGDGNMLNFTSVDFKATTDGTRSVDPSYLGTLCWTNNAVLGGATLYEFAGKDGNNKLVFDEVAENRLEAGKPYIFMPENGNTEIKLYNTDTEAALTEDQAPVNHMYGTIVGKTLVPGVDDNMYYFSSNHIWAVKDFVVNIEVPAYRCYIDYPAVLADAPAPAPAPGRRRVTMGVNGQNTATGMENLNSSDKPVKLLINGQIFILRGEKLFDATGRLVK